MSTSAQAVRRARRQRILQDPAARLSKITGRPVSAESIPIAPKEDSVFDSDLQRLCDLPQTPIDDDYGPVREEDRLLGGGGVEVRPDAEDDSLFTKLLSTRIHIFFYAILVNVVFISNDVMDNYIFLPLLLWEFVEFFYFQAQERKTSPTILRLAVGLAPEVLESVVAIMKRTKTVLQDACLYIFAIIMMQLLINTIGASR